MQYVMSDIHGEYKKYLSMLEAIHFSPADTLYVLGDAIDRGPDPIKLLQDMAGRENVIFLKGNHEGFACYILPRLNVEITAENAENHLDGALMQAILEWQQNGGDATMRGFSALSREEKSDVLDYLSDAPLYEIAEAGEKTFVLVHAGLGNFRQGKKLREYTFEELACVRPDPGRQYFPDDSVYVVAGHTPTKKINGEAKIIHGNHQILIDCGAAWGGRLACLCLETMEEFYV